MDRMAAGRPVRGHTGRRRNERARQDILTAALALVAETGCAGFTMDQLAGRAGVSKRTIYRWWSCRAAVLAEALAERGAARTAGSTPTDLRSFLRATYRAASAPEVAPALKLLMAEAQAGGPPAEALSRLMTRRRTALFELLVAARTAGQLPADADIALLTDVVFGVLWYRLLVGHAELDDRTADQLAILLTRRS